MEFDENKLFVGGLLSATTDEDLKRHFSKYGVVVHAVVARDKLTRSSRGFGFVLFSEQSSADKALEESQVILGRRVEVKKAKARREHHYLQQEQQQHHEPMEQNNGASGWSNGNGSGDSILKFRTKKVFVGGLAANVAEKDFMDYFGRFGRITDVVVMYDSVTNRPRGFGFVTFESEESAERALHKSFHELNGRHVEVKRAVPRENFNNITNTTTAGAGRSTFQPVDYASNNPGYGGFPWFTPHTVYNDAGRFYYGPGVYGCEYPVGYPTNNLFMAPFPRATFYCPLIVGGSTYPMHHVGSPAYSVYGNVGTAVMGAMVGGYNEIHPSVSDAKYNASQTEGLRLDLEHLHLKKNVAAGALLNRVRDNNN